MSEWPMVKLGKLGKWTAGGTPSRRKHEYFNGEIPWASIADLNDGPIIKTAESITELGLDNSSAKIYPVGSILVAMYGSIGKLGINTVPMASSQAIACFIPNKEIERDYAFWSLYALRSKLISIGRGGTQKNIGQGLLKDIEIPLPPLGEQNRIAKILGKVAESTRKIESELELLGRLPLFDWSWTGENQKLADVVIVRSGTVDPTLPENQKLLLIAPDSIESDTGNLLELKTCEEAGVTSGKYHFHRGDVLYSKIRPYLNKVAIAPCDGLCSADMYALETKGNLTPETLQAILMSRQFLAYTSQTSGRASIPKVNRKTLLAYEVPKLSDAQIFEITKKIQTVNKVRALLHQKLALLKELQCSLSARAFAGQL